MLGSDDLFRWFDSRSSQCILCFRVPCDVTTIAHFIPIVYGMMNSVRGELFLWYRDKDLQTVAPYSCRRFEFVTWSQAQKQHEKHGGLYKAWSFTCFLLSYGQYGTLSTSLFSFLRVIAHPAATHCNILWHSWPWCLKSIPHHDHAFKECKLSQDTPHPEWLQNQDVNKHRFCRQDGATQVDYLHSSSEQSNFNTRSNSISTSSYIHTEHCNFK